MKKVIVMSAVLVFAAALAFADGKNDLILHGYIVDNMCAGEHKAELKEFVKTHPKTCMLKPGCVDSGFAILADEDGQLYEFDAASNVMAANFLKSDEDRTDVVIIAEKNGDKLMVEQIRNRRIVK